MFDKSSLRITTVVTDTKIVKPVTIARDLGKFIDLGSEPAPGDRVIESPPDGIADGCSDATQLRRWLRLSASRLLAVACEERQEVTAEGASLLTKPLSPPL